VVLLLWLLLASGDLFYEKTMRVLPVAADRRAAAKVANDTEEAVAGYLVATALINLGQAAAVGLAMWLIGMPDPMLWAVLTFALEFIPYLGGAVNVGLLAIAAFSTFSGIWQILAAPGSYLVITTLQNNLVSPLVYGKHLRLNPVAVFVGVLFWWTLWGRPGGLPRGADHRHRQGPGRPSPPAAAAGRVPRRLTRLPGRAGPPLFVLPLPLRHS
jgi:predicted PurR-regulated permease PerM